MVQCRSIGGLLVLGGEQWCGEEGRLERRFGAQGERSVNARSSANAGEDWKEKAGR